MQLVFANALIVLGGLLIFLTNVYIPEVSDILSRWRQRVIEQQPLGSNRRINQEVIYDWELRSRWISEVLLTLVSGVLIIKGFGNSVEQIETRAGAIPYFISLISIVIIFCYLMMKIVRKKGGGQIAQAIIVETTIFTLAGSIVIGAAWKDSYVSLAIIAGITIVVLTNTLFIIFLKPTS
jgi:predicted permease